MGACFILVSFVINFVSFVSVTMPGRRGRPRKLGADARSPPKSPTRAPSSKHGLGVGRITRSRAAHVASPAPTLAANITPESSFDSGIQDSSVYPDNYDDFIPWAESMKASLLARDQPSTSTPIKPKFQSSEELEAFYAQEKAAVETPN